MLTAKVYVWKDEFAGTKGVPWKIGTATPEGIVVIRHEFVTRAEAWEWLETNYKRDTV